MFCDEFIKKNWLKILQKSLFVWFKLPLLYTSLSLTGQMRHRKKPSREVLYTKPPGNHVGKSRGRGPAQEGANFQFSASGQPLRMTLRLRSQFSWWANDKGGHLPRGSNTDPMHYICICKLPHIQYSNITYTPTHTHTHTPAQLQEWRLAGHWNALHCRRAPNAPSKYLLLYPYLNLAPAIMTWVQFEGGCTLTRTGSFTNIHFDFKEKQIRRASFIVWANCKG